MDTLHGSVWQVVEYRCYCRVLQCTRRNGGTNRGPERIVGYRYIMYSLLYICHIQEVPESNLEINREKLVLTNEITKTNAKINNISTLKSIYLAVSLDKLPVQLKTI